MDFRRLFDLIPYQQARYPNKAALVGKEAAQWRAYSTAECLEQINRFSAGLLDKGFEKGQRIAILSLGGSPAWNFIDLGSQQLGLITVPIHASADVDDLVHILKECEAPLCLVANGGLFQTVRDIQAQIPSLRYVYCLENLPNTPHWSDLCSQPTAKHLATFEGLKAAIHEDDLATIIYTSGTTGLPKGVMLSHKNIVSNIKATISLVPINCDKTTLSFLPMSHIFERMVVYTYMAVGASIYYAEGPDQLSANFREVRPHYFTAVPRILERMYDAAHDEAGPEKGWRRRLLRWAVQLGKRYEGPRRIAPGLWLRLKLADLLVFRRWRAALGGRVEGVAIGAAALQPALGKLFSAAGIEVREGYGLTETSPVVTFNRFEPGGVRFGTVGIPLPGVELRIDQPNEHGEGEVMVKGPNVMMGYYKQEEQTARVLSEDGWLRTGDIGTMVHKRFLKITDRKKDIFKTSSGKYIAPLKIENALRASSFVDHCMIIGFNRPFVAALIVPSFNRLQRWSVANNVHWTSPQFMVINPKIVAQMEQVIQEVNNTLNSAEKIRGIHLLFEDWTIAGGEYTTTLKLRRPQIIAKFQKEVEYIYAKAT
ncbi:MAG: long-chain fatty acid--CoA ligase [Bacteroidota bacterium]